MAEKKPTQPKMVKHTLEYDHDHGGEIVPAGKIIEVTESQAARIKEAHTKRRAEEKASAE